MDMNELIVQLTDAKSKAQTAEGKVSNLERDLAEARGAQHEAETKARDLETELATARAEAESAPTAEEREEAKKDSEAKASAVEFLTEVYTAVLTAAGKTDITAPDNVAELVSGIKEHKAELSAVLPIGGVSEGAGHEHDDEPKQDFSSFKTNRSR